MGRQSYGAQSQIRGDNAALIAIYQLPDANALETAANIRSAMEKLSKDFRPTCAGPCRSTRRISFPSP